MMHTSSSLADHRSPTPDDVDDSCIAQYVEIVPLDISRRNDFAATEVKDEIMVDIKQEPEDQYEQCGASDANVSLSSFTEKIIILPIKVWSSANFEFYSVKVYVMYAMQKFIQNVLYPKQFHTIFLGRVNSKHCTCFAHSDIQ